MGEIKILSGGVPDKNFNIQKWVAYGRSGKHFQYSPRYKEESLSGNPVNNLGEAKRTVKDWYDRKIIYERMLKQGRELKGVGEMLEEKGMI